METTNSPQEASPRPKKKHHPVRWIILILVIIVALAITLAALAPTIASSDSSRAMVLSNVNKDLNGRADFEGLRVGWFSPLDVTNLVLTDAQGRKVVQIASFHRGEGLWSLALRKKVGSVVIDKPEITLYISRWQEQPGGDFRQTKCRIQTGPTGPARAPGAASSGGQADGSRRAASSTGAAWPERGAKGWPRQGD